MNYRNNAPGEKTRILRRLWEVEVFIGDPDDVNDGTTEVVTVVAWNAVDAIRKVARPVARQPDAVCYVTWPKNGDPSSEVFRIEDPKKGPSDEKIDPTIPIPEEEF